MDLTLAVLKPTNYFNSMPTFWLYVNQLGVLALLSVLPQLTLHISLSTVVLNSRDR